MQAAGWAAWKRRAWLASRSMSRSWGKKENFNRKGQIGIANVFSLSSQGQKKRKRNKNPQNFLGRKHFQRLAGQNP